MTESNNRDLAVRDFLEQWRRDQSEGVERELAEYLGQFPGHDDVIARAYLRHRHALDRDRDESSIGPYTTSEELGRGGQGVVYRARHTELGHEVALKVLRRVGPGGGQIIERFYREAKVAARLNHPGICQVVDAGIEDSIPFMAMQFVEGETLDKRIQRAATESKDSEGIETFRIDGEDEAPVPDAVSGSRSSTSVNRKQVNELLILFEKAARALHVAHEAGVVHRDVKPANIMVRPDGEPVLLDFGLARSEDDDLQTLTATGDFFGTPAYMSPEQLAAQRIRIDARTDVWSLGVALFESLTLRRPFEAPSREALYQAIMTREAPSLREMTRNVPTDLAVVLAKALEKDRDRRYASAEEFADELERIRTNRTIRARRPGPVARTTRWMRRNPIAITTIAAVVLLLASALGITLFWLQEVEGVSKQRADAIDERTAALELAQSRLQVSRSRELLTSDPGTALLLAVHAAQDVATPMTRAACLDALLANHETHRIAAHQGAVSDVHISPCGRYALTLSVANRHNAIRHSPKGNLIPHDQSLRLFSLKDRRPLLEIHIDHSPEVTWSSDGERFALIRNPEILEIWASSPARRISAAALPTERIKRGRFHFFNRKASYFSPGLERLAIEKHEGGIVIYSTNEERVIDTKARSYGLACSADRRVLGFRTWGGKGTEWFDATTGRALPYRETDGITYYWLGSSGHQLLRRDRMYDAITGQVRKWEHPYMNEFGKPALTRSARHLVFSVQGSTHQSAPSFVTLDLESCEESARFELGPEPLTAIDLNNEVLIARGDSDMRTLSAWDLTSGKHLKELRGHDSRITALSIGSFGLIASGDESGEIRVWQLHRPRLDVHQSMLRDTSKVVLAPDGQTAIDVSPASMRLRRPEDAVDRKLQWGPSTPTQMITSPDGRRAAIIYEKNPNVMMVDLAEGSPLAMLTCASPPHYLRWTPDSKHAFVIGDGFMEIIDTDRAKTVAMLPINIGVQLLSLSWSPAAYANRGVASFYVHDPVHIIQEGASWRIERAPHIRGVRDAALTTPRWDRPSLHTMIREEGARRRLALIDVADATEVSSWVLPSSRADRIWILDDRRSAVLSNREEASLYDLETASATSQLLAHWVSPDGGTAWIIESTGAVKRYESGEWTVATQVAVTDKEAPRLISSPNGAHVVITGARRAAQLIVDGATDQQFMKTLAAGTDESANWDSGLQGRVFWSDDSQALFIVEQDGLGVRVLSTDPEVATQRFSIDPAENISVLPWERGGTSDQEAKIFADLRIRQPISGGPFILIHDYHHWSTFTIYSHKGTHITQLKEQLAYQIIAAGTRIFHADANGLALVDLVDGSRSRVVSHLPAAAQEQSDWQIRFAEQGGHMAAFRGRGGGGRHVATLFHGPSLDSSTTIRADRILGFTPDGRHLLTRLGNWEGLRVHESASGRLVGTRTIRDRDLHLQAPIRAYFSSDSRYVAIEVLPVFEEDRTFPFLLRMPTLELVATLPPSQLTRNRVRWTKDGRILVSLQDDGLGLAATDIQGQTTESRIASRLRIMDFHPSNRNDLVFILDIAGDLKHASLLGSGSCSTIMNLGPGAVSFWISPDERLACAMMETGLLRMFDLNSGALLWERISGLDPTVRAVFPWNEKQMMFWADARVPRASPGTTRERGFSAASDAFTFDGLRLPIDPIRAARESSIELIPDSTRETGLYRSVPSPRTQVSAKLLLQDQARLLADQLSAEWLNYYAAVKRLWALDIAPGLRDAALAALTARGFEHAQVRAEVQRLLRSAEPDETDVARALRLAESLPRNSDEILHALMLANDQERLEAYVNRNRQVQIRRLKRAIASDWTGSVHVVEHSTTVAYLALAELSLGREKEASTLADLVQKAAPGILTETYRTFFGSATNSQQPPDRAERSRWVRQAPPIFEDRRAMLQRFLTQQFP